MDGQAFTPVTRLLDNARGELRQALKRHGALETDVANLKFENEQYQSLLMTLCIQAQTLINGADKTAGGWTWDRRTLPPRAEILEHTIGRMAPLRNEIAECQLRAAMQESQIKALKAELAATIHRLNESELNRRHFESLVAEATGKVALAEYIMHLERDKNIALAGELDRVAPYSVLKRMREEEKLAKKASASPLQTPLDTPLLDPN